MKVAIVSKQLAEFDGGSQRSMRELGRRLLEAGHQVSAVSGTVPSSAPFPCVAVDASEKVHDVLAELRPDVVLAQLQWSGAATAAARRLGVPSVFFSRLGECLHDADLVVFNSGYCAAQFPAVSGRSMVVAPPIDVTVAECSERAGRDVVLMVNPVRVKGGERFVRIAAHAPQHDFLAVGGWWPPSDDGIDLGGLPNLTHQPPLRSLEPIWRRAIVLLVPSLWPEPAGRVIVEALAAGVPVITSGVGGTREMLGGAGRVVEDADDPAAWIEAIAPFVADEGLWAEQSVRGRASAAAYQRTSAAQMAALLAELERLVERPIEAADRPLSLVEIPPALAAFRFVSPHTGPLLDPHRWEDAVS